MIQCVFQYIPDFDIEKITLDELADSSINLSVVGISAIPLAM
jgi:hypothetical protein